MKILIVVATDMEILPFINTCKLKNVEILVTGVGQVLTTFNLTKKLVASNYSFDLIINAGIAGSFDFSLPLGSVYQISSDCFADFGIEDKNTFIPIYKTDFFTDNIINNDGLIINDFSVDILPKASAVTSNIVYGEKNSIEKIKNLFPYQLASMEGAAFLYVCKSLKIRCLQIRSISNYVTERNKEKWQISLAIENLNKNLINIIDELVI